METDKLIEKAREHGRQLIGDIFPDDSGLYDDVWGLLVPVFGEWAENRDCVRQNVWAQAGLGFSDYLDLGMPVALMTVVATMLELRYAGEYTPNKVAVTVRNFARDFGSPESLQRLLVERVPKFCMEIIEEMEKEDQEGEFELHKLDYGKKTASYRAADEYTIITDREAMEHLDFSRILEFKKENGPGGYHVWIDESQGDVFVGGEPLKLGKMLRRVLRYLVELQGQRVSHNILVRNCGNPKIDYTGKHEITSRRWIIGLRKAGKGQLRKLIETIEGGFSYSGPGSFCIIKPVVEDFRDYEELE